MMGALARRLLPAALPPAARRRALAAAAGAGTGGAPSSAAKVRALRERTGAGMLDVKRALEAADWDEEVAADALRAKGLAKAAKKAGRAALQGLVGVAVAEGGATAALVEVNSETDFVARNETFQRLVGAAAAAALRGAESLPTTADEANGSAALDIDALLAASAGVGAAGGTLGEYVAEVAATTGENVRLRRAALVSAPEGGTVEVYAHNCPSPEERSMGQMAAAVALRSGAALQKSAGGAAMHAVAARPAYLSREHVPAADLERERTVLTEQALASGKPEAVVAKMVTGRLNKFYAENCLVDQPYVVDDKTTVAKLVGGQEELVAFARFQVGEGLEAPVDES